MDGKANLLRPLHNIEWAGGSIDHKIKVTLETLPGRFFFYPLGQYWQNVRRKNEFYFFSINAFYVCHAQRVRYVLARRNTSLSILSADNIFP